MKKSLLYIMLLVTGISISQTTMEEYNYLTKGYKLDKETGRDIKSGYVLLSMGGMNVPTVENGKTIYRSIQCHAFTLKETKEIKGFLITLSREDTTYLEYFCIPLPSSNDEVSRNANEYFFSKMAEAGYPISASSYLWGALNLMAKQILHPVKLD